MWQEKQKNQLKSEINANLAYLSGTTDLCKIIHESIREMMSELDSNYDQSHPWPLLPMIVSESFSGDFKPAIPAAASLQFMKAAAEIFDDIEDADSSSSLATRYGNAIATNIGTTLVILAERAVLHLKARNIEDSRISMF